MHVLKPRKQNSLHGHHILLSLIVLKNKGVQMFDASAARLMMGWPMRTFRLPVPNPIEDPPTTTTTITSSSNYAVIHAAACKVLAAPAAQPARWRANHWSSM